MLFNALTYFLSFYSFFFNLDSKGAIHVSSRNLEQVIDTIPPPQFVCDRTADSLELVKFYNALDGPNWIIKWNLGAPIDSWHGVLLNTEGCIRCLNFTLNSCDTWSPIKNNLKGELPDLKLPFLKTFILFETEETSLIKNLTGTIPNFSHLESIEILGLFGNFSGEIPNFSNMPLLNALSLTGEFAGNISDFSNLPNLENMALRGNFLGNIPDFSFLPKLNSLSITGFTSTLSFNSELSISKNVGIYSCQNISGIIPNFSNLPNLKFLDLRCLSCVGEIPNFTSLTNLKLLNIWGLQNVSGPLPDFSSLSSLTGFSVGFCPLKGIMPTFQNLTKLENIYVTVTFLEGSSPLLSTNPNIDIIWLPGNNLDSIIPFYSTTNPNLRSLDLRSNKFTFEDILPNLESNRMLIKTNKQVASDSLYYAYQDSVYSDTIILINEFNFLKVDLGFDKFVSNNIYYWYKDNTPFDTIIGSNELIFLNIKQEDSGIYKLHIKNPLAPDLTLKSFKIEIIVSPCSNVESLTYSGCENDGYFVNINGTIYNELNPTGTETFPGSKDCDSIITISLSFNPSHSTFESYVGCKGDGYSALVGNTLFDEFNPEGEVSINSVLGCDSIIKVQLTFYNLPIAAPDVVLLNKEVQSYIIYPLDNDSLYDSKSNYSVRLINVPIEVIASSINDNEFIFSIVSNTVPFRIEFPYEVCHTISGCCSTGIIKLQLTSNLDQPLLLTPNGDNVNDILVIPGVDAFPNNELTIVNRWGDVVYKAKPYMNDWGGEGMNGNLLTQGTYYYILRNVGAQLPEGGHIVILK